MLKGICILLETGKKSNGYGYKKGSKQNYHNEVYRQNVGDIPIGYVVHHLCENKSCINPQHLQLLSRSEHMKVHNINNGNSEKTTCRNGHPLDAWSKSNGRYCLLCYRESQLEYYHKNKEHLNQIRNSRLKLQRKENKNVAWA